MPRTVLFALRLILISLVVSSCAGSSDDEGAHADGEDTGTDGEDPANCRNVCSLEYACDWETFDQCMSICEKRVADYPDCVPDLQALNLCMAQLSCDELDDYYFENACNSMDFPCAEEDNTFFACLDLCG